MGDEAGHHDEVDGAVAEDLVRNVRAVLTPRVTNRWEVVHVWTLPHEWRKERKVAEGGLQAVADQLGVNRETLRRWV
jgi:transposase-like protein